MTRDPIVDAVRAKLLTRSRAGIVKYGVTLARTDLTYRERLVHAQEEALDLANYLEWLIQQFDKENPPRVGGHSNAWLPGQENGG